MISAIILAAGESKRMGKPKQLLCFGRSTILEQAIDNFLCSTVDEVIVVLGHRAEDVKRLISTRPARLVINPNYQQGMSTSIIAGLNSVDSRARAVMLALGDQPFIDSRTINRLIEAFHNHDKGIVIPTYRGMRGHPIIFATIYKEKLLALEGDIGARQLVKEYPEDVLEVPTDCEGILVDIDTVDSYNIESSKLR